MDLTALGLRPLKELSTAERSAFEGANACSPPPPPPPLPEGWQEAVVFATGQRYYVHAASGRTAWEIPTSSPTPFEAEAGVLTAGRGGPPPSRQGSASRLGLGPGPAGAGLLWEQACYLVITPCCGSR